MKQWFVRSGKFQKNNSPTSNSHDIQVAIRSISADMVAVIHQW